MTLTTHAIFGAGLASLIPEHPIAAFSLGFVSHFLLDAIPHWDYAILSGSVDPDIGAKIKFDRTLVLDAVRISSDLCLGILLGLLFFGVFQHRDIYGVVTIFCGAVGAILPDALQFVYAHFKKEPLISLQAFHHWVHTDIRLGNRPWVGIPAQILFVIFSCMFFWFI